MQTQTLHSPAAAGSVGMAVLRTKARRNTAGSAKAYNLGDASSQHYGKNKAIVRAIGASWFVHLLGGAGCAGPRSHASAEHRLGGSGRQVRIGAGYRAGAVQYLGAGGEAAGCQ